MELLPGPNIWPVVETFSHMMSHNRSNKKKKRVTKTASQKPRASKRKASSALKDIDQTVVHCGLRKQSMWWRTSLSWWSELVESFQDGSVFCFGCLVLAKLSSALLLLRAKLRSSFAYGCWCWGCSIKLCHNFAADHVLPFFARIIFWISFLKLVLGILDKQEHILDPRLLEKGCWVKVKKNNLEFHFLLPWTWVAVGKAQGLHLEAHLWACLLLAHFLNLLLSIHMLEPELQKHCNSTQAVQATLEKEHQLTWKVFF